MTALKGIHGIEDINDKESEFYKLKYKSHTKPYFFRISRMKLLPAKRDCVSYTVNKFSDLAQEGYVWKRRGDMLYTLQLLSSSLVPVLIGIIGTFKNSTAEIAIRIFTIFLSIMGTMSITIENVYNFRQRGQTRVHYADKMNTLFQIYDANCSESKNSVEALDNYMSEFYKLLENARNDSFVGQYKNDDTSGTTLV